MRVLLTNPKSSANAFESFGFVFPPLGLLYIAATGERAGHTIAIEDFCVSRADPSSYDFSDYDVVGISTNTRRSPGALEIARRAKAAGCTTIMGGPHPAFADEELLKSGVVDFIVRGEGELTFPLLLDAIENSGDVSSIRGISFQRKGSLQRTPPAELIASLDDLPLPARHLIDNEVYKKAGLRYGGERPVAVISSSRGCPHHCSFCITPHMYGRRWRARSAASVVAEIEEVYFTYGYRAVAFCDDNFTVSSRRVKDICSLILEKNLDVWWWCLSTPAMLVNNEDMVRLMARAGAKTVYIGVESANPETLKEFNKGRAEDMPHQAVSLLKRNGIEAFASYILGGINDDAKAVLRTIRFAKALDTAVAQFTILTPYPGTDLYTALEGRLRHKKWHLYDGVHLVFRHKQVPFVIMELLLIWAYASFYSRGWRAVKGFAKALVKNTPLLRRVFGKSA